MSCGVDMAVGRDSTARTVYYVSPDRLAAAVDKVNSCDNMQATACALETIGIIKPEQRDRLIDFIKRFKHGVS